LMWINHMLGGAYRQLIARLNNAFVFLRSSR
jgi:hypothetical protein